MSVFAATLVLMVVVLAGCLKDDNTSTDPTDPPTSNQPPIATPTEGTVHHWDIGAITGIEAATTNTTRSDNVTAMDTRMIWSTTNRSGAAVFEIRPDEDVLGGECLVSSYFGGVFLNNSKIIAEPSGGYVYVRQLIWADGEMYHRTTPDFPYDRTIMFRGGQAVSGITLRLDALGGLGTDCSLGWLVVAYELPPEADALALGFRWMPSQDRSGSDTLEGLKERFAGTTNASIFRPLQESDRVRFASCTSHDALEAEIRDQFHTPECKVTMSGPAPGVYTEFHMDVDVRWPDVGGWVESWLQVPYGFSQGTWERHYHFGSVQEDGHMQSPGARVGIDNLKPRFHAVSTNHEGPLCFQSIIRETLQRDTNNGHTPLYEFYSVSTGLELSKIAPINDQYRDSIQAEPIEDPTPYDMQTSC